MVDLGYKTGTQVFLSLNLLCCITFPSLVILGISFYNHKVISCAGEFKHYTEENILYAYILISIHMYHSLFFLSHSSFPYIHIYYKFEYFLESVYNLLYQSSASIFQKCH